MGRIVYEVIKFDFEYLDRTRGRRWEHCLTSA